MRVSKRVGAYGEIRLLMGGYDWLQGVPGTSSIPG